MMGKKKKIALISVLSVVLALMLAGGIIVWIVFRPVDVAPREDMGYETVCYELPTDGSSPEEHTGVENIGYMNWRLKHQTYWYSEMHGGVDTIDKQSVTTYKQYYDGVLIATDIATSNLVNSAIQFCALDDVVLKRYSAGGPSTYNGIDTVWDDGKPEGYTIPEYKEAMGFPPTEFSVFVINDKTVLDCTAVTENSDGTYTQTFYLNMDAEPSENDAGYYYKQQMIEKGGLHGDPVFTEAVTITYNFDSDWQVLSSETREVYKANKGFVANCSGYSRTDYTYGDKELSYNPVYENYFKEYVNDYAPPKEKELTAADCLAEAFAGVLQGESKFALDFTVDGENYSGIAQLDIDRNDIRVDLGNIKLYLRGENDGQYLYVSYGDNVKAKIALSDISSIIPSGGSTYADFDGGADILDNLLAVLGGDENFTLAADKLSATLTPTIDVGKLLGADIDLILDLNFKFDISAEGAVTLDKVSADTNVLGSEISIGLSFTDKGIEALSDVQAAEYTKIDVKGIASLAAAQALSVDLSYSGNGVNVDGNATLNTDETALKADLVISVEGNESEPLEISLIYSKGGIYLTLNSFGEQPIKVKADGEEAAGIILRLIGNAMTDTSVDFDIQPVLDLIANIDINGILNTLLKDNGFAEVFKLESADGAALTIDGTALLGLFNVDFELGEVKASIKDGGVIGLSAFGLDAELKGADPFTFDESEYSDAEDVIPLLETIEDIIANQGVTVSGAISFGDDSTNIALTVYGLSVGWADGAIELQLDARLDVNGSAHDFYAEYSAATGELKVAYGAMDSGVGVSLNVAENSEDISTLKNALVALFNRIAGFVNTVAEGGDVIPTVGSFDELLALLKTGGDAADGVAEIASALAEIEETEQKFSVADILNNINLNVKDGSITLDISGITLSVYRTDSGMNLSVQTSAVGFEISDLQIAATEFTDFGIEVENALTAEDVAELLDYLGATVDMLAAETYKITLSGTVTSTAEEYWTTEDAGEGSAVIEEGIKYNLDAGLEYIQGSGFPVHVRTDADDPAVWVAPDMYLHAWVNMVSTIDDVDSVLFDAYIFDGNPVIDGNGKATYTYDPEYVGDGELDIYLSLSRIPQTSAALTHEPVMVYAPMNEIMNILAAGVAITDFGSISTEIQAIDDAISQVAGMLDSLLVDRYLGVYKSQFNSVGSSLIETILGGSLSDILKDIISGLTGSVQPDVGEVAPTALSTEDGGYARERYGAVDNLALTRGESNTALTLVVGETSTTVTKNNYGSGSRLSGLEIDRTKLNDTETLNGLDIDIAYEAENNGQEGADGEEPAPAAVVERVTSLSGYTSFVGADELVKAFINSATHETEPDSDNYTLNNNFFIDGTLSISIGQLVGHNVVVDGLSVNINEAGDVEVNARFHYNGMDVMILGDAVQGASTVDLTIKNGMVYMRRVQTTAFTRGFLGIGGSFNEIEPITIYRAMPIEVFMGDMLNQIAFLLNFNSSIMSLFNIGGDSDPQPEVKKDYGTQLAEYLNSFTFTPNDSGAEWNVEINGTGISNLAGISLANIPVRIAAEKDSNGGYVIRNLGLTTSLFSVLSVSAELNWRNPQEIWDDAAEQTARDLAEKAPSVNMEMWLGGSSIEEIRQSIDWDKLPNTATIETTDENGEKLTNTYHYAEITFTGDTALPDGAVKFGAAEYYLRNLNGEETLLKRAENILYFDATLLSIVEAPDLAEYAAEHYTLIWQPATVADGTLKIIAAYVPAEYEVTFISDYEIEGYVHTYGNNLTFDFNYQTDGHKIDYIEYKGVQYTAENYTDIIIDGDAEIYVHWVEVPFITVNCYSAVQYENSLQVGGVEGYETAYTSTVKLSSDYAVPAASADGYVFLGWFYFDGEGWIIVNDVMADINGAAVGETYELHALWAQVNIEGSGTYTSRTSWFVTYYTSTMEASVSLAFYGNAELVSKVSLSSATFAFDISGNPAASSDSPKEDGSLSVSGVTGSEGRTQPSTAAVTVEYRIAIDGKQIDKSWTATQGGLSITAA